MVEDNRAPVGIQPSRYLRERKPRVRAAAFASVASGSVLKEQPFGPALVEAAADISLLDRRYPYSAGHQPSVPLFVHRRTEACAKALRQCAARARSPLRQDERLASGGQKRIPVRRPTIGTFQNDNWLRIS